MEISRNSLLDMVIVCDIWRSLEKGSLLVNAVLLDLREWHLSAWTLQMLDSGFNFTCTGFFFNLFLDHFFPMV